MKYALDSNTIINMLRGNSIVLDKFDSAVERGDEIVIPPIVHYEMRRGFLCYSAPRKEAAYLELTEQFLVGEMNEAILECGANIYSELYEAKLTVDDSDLLTAAFCRTGGYTIVTNNVKHFNVIDNLQVEDWSVE